MYSMPQTFGHVLCTSLLLAMLASPASAQVPKPKSTTSVAAPPALGTLREENITDSEVRELQKIVAERTPGTIVQFGPVTVGCACGESPSCTHQVMLTVERASPYTAVQFSRVKGTWQLSERQILALRSEQIRQRRLALSKTPIGERKLLKEEIDREADAITAELDKCRQFRFDWPPKKNDKTPERPR